MSPYGTIKSLYKCIVPKSVRHGIYNIRVLRSIRNRLIKQLERTAKHDEIYDQNYYKEIVDPYMEKSAQHIAASIYQAFKPRSVVDVGCGTGLLLLALRDQGVINVKGFDFSIAAIDICKARNLPVERLDLEHDSIPPVCADVVISTEVAEHLPQHVADHFLDTLASVSDRIVLTAAQPGIGVAGTDHVNEQPHEYWIEKLHDRGYQYEHTLTEEWRAEWRKAEVEGCYSENIMIFVRNGSKD